MKTIAIAVFIMAILATVLIGGVALSAYYSDKREVDEWLADYGEAWDGALCLARSIEVEKREGNLARGYSIGDLVYKHRSKNNYYAVKGDIYPIDNYAITTLSFSDSGRFTGVIRVYPPRQTRHRQFEFDFSGGTGAPRVSPPAPIG